ncbi:type IV toxin-antitoxin system AbiEi family antitoxin [Frondihabitans cladoniiphilus]|uniref:AbiEi antitoxin C-terminal domain-containing protein n=1 Tax=Frondihabitans cladoniiphilus TaxID=715785 RepID=A0ABP8VPP5_9MICO
MTTTLPLLLTDTDLPFVELQSARLDGEVFRLDEAFCSVAEFDLPWRRAHSLAPVLAGPASVAAGMTAAWVWGAASAAPLRHDVFVPADRRPGVTGPRIHLRIMAFDDDEVVDFGPVRVTSPARTLVDLVRTEAWSSATRAVVQGLVDEHRLELGQCVELLERRERLPHRKRARVRLGDVFGATAEAASEAPAEPGA